MTAQGTHYRQLKDKWTQRHQGLIKRLWEKHNEALLWFSERSKHLAVGSLGSLMLLASPGKPTLPLIHHLLASNEQVGEKLNEEVFLIADLAKILPERAQPLTPDEEQQVSEVFSRYFGVWATAELFGNRLNRSYGFIGAEQHLARFPGDSMSTHFDSEDEAKAYYSSGMAPGLGAYRYFAQSADQLGEKEKMREKYYVAVQTFLSPGWNERSKELYEFFRFRKMLLVNPQNGKAVIAVIGDAGPAEWTGKHLGGSPEVMKYLERVDGAQRGPVLYFFIDDSDDIVPLGPLRVVQSEHT